MKTLVLTALAFICLSTSAQTFEKSVEHFRKIIVSPKINLVLVQGETESVKIDYFNVDPSKINVAVRHGKLCIYLDGSKFMEKRKRVQRDGWTNMQSIYRHASITAYVTYKKLDKLVARGEQQIVVQTIDSKKFKLSAYGECDITLASVQADQFKAVLYGDHTLKINSGNINAERFKLFGDNKIDVQAIQSEEVSSTTYGESRLKLNARENLSLVTFGESNVSLKGNAEVSKITLGEISVSKK